MALRQGYGGRGRPPCLPLSYIINYRIMLMVSPSMESTVVTILELA
jgi:hypothetical protein